MKAEWVIFICFIVFGIVSTLILDIPKVRKIALKVFIALFCILALIYFAKVVLDLIYAIIHSF